MNVPGSADAWASAGIRLLLFHPPVDDPLLPDRGARHAHRRRPGGLRRRRKAHRKLTHQRKQWGTANNWGVPQAPGRQFRVFPF